MPRKTAAVRGVHCSFDAGYSNGLCTTGSTFGGPTASACTSPDVAVEELHKVRHHLGHRRGPSKARLHRQQAMRTQGMALRAGRMKADEQGKRELPAAAAAGRLPAIGGGWKAGRSHKRAVTAHMAPPNSCPTLLELQAPSMPCGKADGASGLQAKRQCNPHLSVALHSAQVLQAQAAAAPPSYSARLRFLSQHCFRKAISAGRARDLMGKGAIAALPIRARRAVAVPMVFFWRSAPLHGSSNCA